MGGSPATSLTCDRSGSTVVPEVSPSRRDVVFTSRIVQKQSDAPPNTSCPHHEPVRKRALTFRDLCPTCSLYVTSFLRSPSLHIAFSQAALDRGAGVTRSPYRRIHESHAHACTAPGRVLDGRPAGRLREGQQGQLSEQQRKHERNVGEAGGRHAQRFRLDLRPALPRGGHQVLLGEERRRGRQL